MPQALAGLAYLDNDIAIAKGRALLKPMVLAKLIQAARVGPGDRVLDVACGTGYSSAVLARLAGSVVALEEDAELALQAKAALAAVGAGKSRSRRAVDCGLACRRALRRHSPQRRNRNCARDARPTIEAGRPARLRLRPLRRRQRHDYRRSKVTWSAGRFLTRGPGLPGFVAPPAFVF